MKIVTAFDSFKGCISAAQACHAAAMGIKENYPDAEVLEIPLSDGGEGLVNCVKDILDVEMTTAKVHGPLMEEITAEYAVDGKTAYMEMAASSGLTLVPTDRRDPTKTTTYGVGDLIADAIAKGCDKVVMGIGGSATNDGGMGMVKSLQDKGLLSPDGFIADARLKACKFRVACDVSNPLCGKNGASYVFGPQKGATPEQIEELDKRLSDFASKTAGLGIAAPSLKTCPGTGAAGGLGYGMMAYLKAELVSGIETILKIVNFDERIEGASLILTGEGKSDRQTLMGKVPHGVLRHAGGIPVILFSGAIEDESGDLRRAFPLVRSINDGDDRPLEVLLQPQTAIENIIKTVKSLRI